ncbi:defensin beta 134 [Rhinolophus ferrumequinum]|uniref:Defensin beta 134 n=1 Tax=Rhinolophus ferrumequinum TaxID=59479 RepID=A0A7J7TZQ5_RHIFE|nr:defensin beta 134 [Rhinolophus ferrumequinum]
MKRLLTVFVVLVFWDPSLPGLNVISPELYKNCYQTGTCRLQGYRSEKLVGYRKCSLECCAKGFPAP